MSIKSLTSFFFTCAVAAAFVLTTATSGQAITKCKAKVNKKTGEISYWFKYSTGPVLFSYSHFGLPSEHTGIADLYPFDNEDSCQENGKGKRCNVVDDLHEGTIAPAGCKTYIYEEADDTFCEVRVPSCHVGARPLPTAGYWAIENNHGSPALWDGTNRMAWHISSDHVKRSRDEHDDHLKHLNGTEVHDADTDTHTPLVQGGGLKLPTLHQLTSLAQDCVVVFEEFGGIGGPPTAAYAPLHTLCAALWPDTGDAGNCAATATTDATQPETHTHSVCLTADVSRNQRSNPHAWQVVSNCTSAACDPNHANWKQYSSVVKADDGNYIMKVPHCDGGGVSWVPVPNNQHKQYHRCCRGSDDSVMCVMRCRNFNGIVGADEEWCTQGGFSSSR
jgi:hypothetical protein